MRLVGPGLIATVAAAAVLLSASPASAATAGPQDGVDVSFPNGTDLPGSGGAIAVVGLSSGINDGTAATANPSLAAQLDWANGAAARVDVYVNTQHPDPAKAAWWPTRNTARDGSAVPASHGTCRAAVPASAACAYVYGWSVANGDLGLDLRGTTPGRWWLDVEGALGGRGGAHGNDWSTSRTRNRAVLEGMADRLQRAGRAVGLYASPGQFADVIGTVPASSVLDALPSWLTLARSRAGALRLCAHPPLTSGRPLLAQWKAGDLTSGTDQDVLCATFRAAPTPRVTGTRTVGHVAAARTAGWSDAPHLALRWTRDGAPIAGATHRTYRIAARDAGHLIRVVVVGTKDGWSRTVRTSPAVRAHR